jgi:hypothetical protein
MGHVTIHGTRMRAGGASCRQRTLTLFAPAPVASGGICWRHKAFRRAMRLMLPGESNDPSIAIG